MSVTAGFDVVFELSIDAIRRGFLANARVNGVALTPPFELTSRLSESPLGPCFVSIIVTSLDLHLNDERGVGLQMNFEDAYIEPVSDFVRPISSLNGTISAVLPLALLPTGDDSTIRTIGFDSNALTATIDLTSGADLPLGPAASLVQELLKNQPLQLPAFAFRVDPNVDGWLGNSPQFARLEIHNVGSSAVGVFGSCRVGDDRGDPTTMPQRPFSPGEDVRVTLSADAFRSLLFCPAIGRRLEVAASAVPGACGGGPVPYLRGTLARIDARFEAETIVVEGRAEESGICFEASVDFSARFPVSVDAGTLHVGPGQPFIGEPHVDYDFPCTAVAFLSGGLFGIGLMELLRGVMEDEAATAVMSAATELLAAGVGTGAPASPLGVMSSVAMTPDAMTLSCSTHFPIPVAQDKTISLGGGVELIPVEADTPFTIPNPEDVDRGEARIKRRCVDGVYPVSERYQRFVGQFALESYRVPWPFELEVTIETYDKWDTVNPPTVLSTVVISQAGEGEVILDNVRCVYPFPLPEGSVVYQPVTLGYAIDNRSRSIRISNTPTDGSFGISLKVRVSNPHGWVTDLGQVASFAGDEVVIGGCFQADVVRCSSREVVERAKGFAHVTEPPPWELGDGVRPDELAGFVATLMLTKDEILTEEASLIALAFQDEYFTGALSIPTRFIGPDMVILG